MKAKLNFKSKRTIIVISIIAVLAIAAVVSAYFFTKGNDTAGATNAGQEEQASNNGVAITENNNGQNGQNNAPESNSNQPNSQDSTLNANQNDGTQNNDGVNNGTTGETGNNQGVANANQGTTGTNTGATTQQRRTNNNANRTTTNIPGANTDATTTYEQVEENIVVENPWESHMVEWTPENVKTAVVSAKEVKGRDINIEKTAETSTGKTAVSVGDEITYKIKITNNEEKVLNSLYIKDSIPEGTEFVSIDELGIVDEEKTQVSWNLWDLGLKKGESKEVSFKVKVTEKAKEIKTIKNIAYAENTPSDEDKPTKNPVLESSKSHEIVRNNEVMPSKENVPAKVGDKIEYTITVKNLGEVEGTTSIKDSDLAAILENEKATLEGNIILKNGNGNGTKIEKDDLINGFDITVKANETATVKFSLVVNKVDGKIKNVATIGGSKEDEDIVETIDWAIEKSSKLEEKNGTIGDGKAEKGDIIHYTIKITNKGSKKIENLIVEDELLGWIGDTAKKVTIEYNGIETIEGSYEVKQEDIDAQKPVKNMVVGIYDNEEKTSETENPVIEATQNMSVVKEADKTTVKAGDTVNYTITVTNTGNVTLTKIPVTDVLTTSKGTQNLTLYLDKEYTTPVTEIEKLEVTGEGSTIKLYAKYDVTQADIDAQQTIINVATAKDTDSKEVPVTPENSNPSMSVVKEADKTTVKAGDTVNYTITVTNTGNVTLTKIPVTDVLTTSKGTQNLTLYLDKEYTTPVTEIEKLEVTGEGSTIKLYAKYDVTQADIDAQQTIINVATAKDTDSKEVPVTPENSNPSMSVVKEADKTTVKAGDTVNYTITVTNTGNVTLTKIPVTDVLTTSKGTQNLTLYLDKEYTTPVTEIEKLEVTGEGSTIKLYAKYDVTQADIDAQQTIINVATAKDTDSKEVPVTPENSNPSMSVVKEADKTTVKAGDTVNYTITVTNTGNVTLTKIPVTDVLTTSKGTQNLTLYLDKEYTTPVKEIEKLEVTGEGSTIKLYAKYDVTQADIDAQQTIINVATAKDTDSKEVPVTPENSNPSMSVVKEADKTTVKAGDTVNYTITVTNTGNVTLTKIPVTDVLTTSKGTQNLTLYLDKEYTTPVTEIEKLEVTGEGSTIKLYAKYDVTQADIDAQQTIINVATAKDTDSKEVPVTPENSNPSMSVVKEADKTTVKAGDTVNYTITVTNTGNVTLTKIPVTDVLTTSKGTQNLTLYLDKEYTTPVTEIEKLEVTGEGSTIKLYAKYDVTQADIDAQQTIINVATAKDTDSKEVPVTPENSNPSMSVVKEADKTTVKAGDTVNYTITVTNTGNVTLTKIPVTDVLTTSKGTQNLTLYLDKEYTTPVTEIEKLEVTGEGSTIKLYAKYDVTQADIDAQQTIINVATAKDTDSKEVPVTPENSNPSMSVVKEADKTTVKAGDTVNYTITVTNTGNVTLTKIPVTDVLTTSKGTQNLTLYLDKEYTTPVTEIEKLEVTGEGSTIKLYAKYDVTQADIDAQQTIINVATAKDTDSKEVPVTPENSNPSMSVVKEADKTTVKAGDTVNYTITVTNTGNVTLTKIPVTDVLTTSKGTQNLTLYLDKEYTTPVTEIEKLEVTGEGSTIKLYAKYDVTQADIDAQQTIINVATAKDTDSKEVPVTPENSNPSMSVVKEADKTTVKAGDTVNYTITVTNTGNVTLTKIPVTDVLTTSKGTQNLTLYLDKEYTTPVTEIEKLEVTGEGSTIKLYAKYDVTQADIDAQQTIINVATAKDTDSKEVPVTPENSNPSMSVVKEADKTTVKAGDTVNYTITVTNTGNVTLTKIPVTDVLTTSKGTQNLTLYLDKEYTTPVTEIEKLEVTGEGSTIKLYAKYDVTQADIDAQQTIINVATAKDTDSKEVPVTPENSNPSMSVVKEADKTTVKAGDTVNYTITVTNTGNVTLTKIPVTDVLTTSKGTQNLTLYLDKEYTTPVTEIEKLEVTGEGSTIKLYAKYDVTQADIDAQQTIINVATAKDTDSKEVPVTPENSNPSMSVVKEADKTTVKAGDTVNYTITVTNTGNVTLTKIPVTDVLTTSKGTQNLTLYLDKEYTTPVTEIEKLEVTGEGSTIKLYAKYDVTQADIDAQQTIINVATAKDTDSKEVPVTPENSNPSMSVVKEADKTTVKAGDTVNYTITVTNTGNVTLTKIPVTDVLTTSKGTQNLTLYLDKEYTTPVTEIEKLEVTGEGSTIKLYAKYDVTQADIDAQQTIINVATAKDTDSKEVPVTPEKSNPSIDVQKTIVKVKDTEIPANTEVTIKAQKEDKITYQIVATNNGNTTLSNVKVTDDKNVTLESATLPERLADMTITIGNNINANTNLLGRNDITLQPGETITLTVSYTLQKADVLGSKDFVNKATATGKYDKTEPKAENSATIETEFTPEMGEKSVEKVWDDENYAFNRPNDITVQLMNGTTKVGDPVKLSETNEWKHTWKELPLEDGNGKAITYTVKEDKVENYTTTYSKEQNGKFVITNSYNKPKAGGTITIHSTKSQEVNAPLDVVFILDTSGSMDNNSRATNAVTAINKAIAQVQGYNQYNRVGVVGFSGTYSNQWGTSKDKTDSTELLKLKRYTAKTTSDNVKQYLTINNKKINTNVNELATQNGRYVDGGTYTQIGIAEASNMLQKADKKVTIDGVEVTRTPVIILISDGEPTYYTETYKAVTSQNRDGTGSDTTADHGYYTILSANHYKQQVTTHYGRTAMMYTIGMGISKDNDDDLFARTVLNPDATNKNACKNTYNRWSTWQSEEYNLYSKIKNTSNYADGAYFGEMGESELTKILKQVIQSSIPKERTEKITAEQIKNAKVELKDIDTSKEFSLKAGKTTYNTFKEAETAGVIAGDETNGYYVDLTKVPAGSDLEISYHEK